MLATQLAAQPWRGSRNRRSNTRDEDVFYYGLGVGLNLTKARLDLAPMPFPVPTAPGRPADTLYNVSLSGSPGINISLVGVLKLSPNLDLRLVPAVSLQQRDVELRFARAGIQTRKIESTYLEIPLLLKYKSELYRNYRVYVITGPKYSINTISNERVENDATLLKIKSHDIGWTIGAGLDLYGSIGVKLAPEISYTFGLRNVYVDQGTDISGAIRSLYTSAFAITVYFE